MLGAKNMEQVLLFNSIVGGAFKGVEGKPPMKVNP